MKMIKKGEKPIRQTNTANLVKKPYNHSKIVVNQIQNYNNTNFNHNKINYNDLNYYSPNILEIGKSKIYMDQ
jgi:hypothetical protein